MIRISTPTMIIAATLLVILVSCRKTEIKKEYVTVEPYENLPQLRTRPLDSVSYYEAYGSCEVFYEGGSPVTECGLCWDTDPSPLRLGSHIGTGSGKGITKGKIEGLKPSTVYYLRAYAKNGEGISYGNEITFTTSAGWSRLGPNPGGSSVTDLFFANGVFYASTYFDVYTSTDLTKPWKNVLSNAGCFAAKNNSVYLGGYYLYITTNNGANWSSQYVGTVVNDLLVTNAIYATSSNGVRKSINGGQSWTQQNSGLGGNTNVLAAKGNDIYVGTSSGIYKSINSAVNWTSVKPGLDVQNIDVSGSNLLAGTMQGVYISKDDGLTWTSTGILPAVSSKVYSSGKNVVAWSPSGNLVYLSSDEGLTWRKIIYHESENPQVITGDGSNYYAASSSGIYKLSVNSK